VVVDGNTNVPIPHATVALGTGRTGNSPVAWQRADALGRFVFREVPAPSAYVLEASAIGYFPSQYGMGEPADGRRAFTLTPGEWVKDARVALWRPGAVSGTVVDEVGEPVVGAYVRALFRVSIGGRARLAAGPVAVTDDRGVYRLPNLPQGSYMVAVASVQRAIPGVIEPVSQDRAESRGRFLALLRRPGDANGLLLGDYPTPAAPAGLLVYAPRYYPDARSPLDATVLTIDSGERRDGVDFRLTPEPGWRVSGVVEEARERGQRRVMRLIPAGAEDLGPGSEAAETSVDDDGRFQFLNVPAGSYTLDVTPGQGAFSITANLVSATSLSPVRLPGTPGVVSRSVAGAPGFVSFARSLSDAGWRSARMPVDVRDRDVTGLRVVLEEGSVISGSLQLDPESVPPRHRYAGLTLEPSLTNDVLVMPSVEVADASDPWRPWERPRPFEMRGLTPGRYRLSVTGRDVTIKAITWHGHDWTSEAIEVWPGQRISDVVVTVTTRVASLTGVIRDSHGAAAGRAGLIYFPVNPRGWDHLSFNPVCVGSVTAGPEGRYVVEGLPGGEYYLVAVPAHQRMAWRDPGFLAAAVPLATRVAVTWGQTLHKDLRLKEVTGR